MLVNAFLLNSRDILPQRPTLKVILMSATLNAQTFAVYFNRCPVINIPGFTHAVRELFLEDVIELIGPVELKSPQK